MKKLSKLITWPLVLIFLYQNIGWTVPSPQLSAINYQPSTIFIPEQYGRVEKTNRQTGKQANGQTVVLIKDAHCNYEAQTNIAKILDILIRDYKIDLIGEEGASGYINPSIVLESNPKEEIRKNTSDKFLKSGLLVASEALSINKGKEPGFTIWGIEDLKLYLKDYKAFRDTFGTNSSGRRFIELLSKTIEQLKKKIYPTELQRFDSFVKGYESNKIPLSSFIRVLYYNYGITSDYKNLKLILKSIRLEERIDFNNVERERANLIKELEKALPKEDLQELVKQSLLYKLGKIPAVSYYKYLEPLAIRRPILTGYIKLIKLQDKLDEAGLFTDLEILLENIYIKLCKDKTAHNLYQLDRDINILNKIFKLEATRENMAYYKENQIRFKPENLLQFIKIQAPLNKITLAPELNNPSFIEDVNNAITPAEEFYRLAIERDTALVENLLQVMQKNKKDKAVLVCGGFHAEGIKRILEDKGISILTIIPSITKIQEDCQKTYLRRMLDERINPERMLAELGMETLRPEIATGPQGIQIGLPQPIIDALNALRGRGKEVDEELTPKDFLDILPLLRELYKQGGSIASLVENAVSDYNASLPEGAERINLEKPPSETAVPATDGRPLVGKWQFDLSPKASNKFRDTEEIISDLEKYNVYWQGFGLDKETKWLILKRIQNLRNLPVFIQQKLGQNRRIRAINVKGSYLWGPGIIEGIENYNPKDLDVTVIVEGDENSSIDIKLTSEEKGGLFPDQDWTTKILEIKLIGIDNFAPTDTLINFPEINRAISARFSGITISGSTLFTEAPPLSLILEKIRDLIGAARIEDINAVSRYDTSVSAINTIIAYFKVSEQPDTSKENRETINRLIHEELERLTPYILAKIRVIKRLVEINLWFSFVAGNYHGFKDIFETESIYSLEKAKDVIHRLLLNGVTAEELLTEGNIFQIEYALLEAEENLKEAFEKLQQLTTPTVPVTESPAHIAYMGVPEDSPHYSTEIEHIKGKTVSIPFERKTVNVDQQLLEGLELTEQEFLAMLTMVLIEAERYPGADKSRLHDITAIALFNKSSHLAENHIGDGFIGINAYVLELYQKLKERFGKAAANNFIQYLLEHELVHELTGKGEEIESDLMKRDAERFVSLLGENTDAILDLLYTTSEFIEWVKFYSYKDTATKSFSALNRTKYEEDLVQALESGETTVQIAHLKIQDFKGEFNVKGEAWGIGHELGDLALEIIGFVLQGFLNKALEKYGAKAIVYNQGPGFYIIFQNLTDPSIVKGILGDLVKRDSEFKKAVIEGIKWKLKNVLPEDVYNVVSLFFSRLTQDNLNIYGGISELQEARPRELEDAKAIADTIDIQAIETAKYAQLTINSKTEGSYIEILEMAERDTKEERRDEIDRAFITLLESVRAIQESNIELFNKVNSRWVRISKDYILSREYTSFHTPMAESYRLEETYERLFNEYSDALREGDSEKLRRIQKVIAGKTVTYKDTQIHYGNQRFKDTINYIIRNRPQISLRLTFRIGGDEYGKLIWDAGTKVLRILRFDGNNIGATTFQHGREIGDKVIDEQLRIIHETEDVSDIPKKVQEIDAPDVTVTYRGKTFQSRPMVSIGEVIVDTKLIQKAIDDELISAEDAWDRDYSVIQGRADTAATWAKKRFKRYQSMKNGKIDYTNYPNITKFTYEITQAFAEKDIPSFREYTLPRANSEIAEFIVKSSEIRTVVGEVAKIIGIGEKEIEEAILKGLEGRERIDIMELLKLARDRGLAPEDVFNLAVKISGSLDKLLGKEAKERGDEVIEAILKKMVDRLPEGITARQQFMNTLRQTLTNIGISTEEIDTGLELIEMGLHIIAFDPLLDITEINASYFDFIPQIAEMIGIGRDTVVKAFTEGYFIKQIELLVKETGIKITEEDIIAEELKLSDKAEKLLLRKMPSDRYERIQEIARRNKAYFEGAKKINLPESELLKAVNRLKLYQKLKDNPNVTLSLEGVNDSFNNLDFPNGTVRRETVRYLSTLHAVENDLDRIFEVFSNAFQSEQSVFLSIPAGQFIMELLINEGGGIEIVHNPGLQAFINKMKQTKIAFKLELRAKDDKEKRLLDEALEKNPGFKDYIVTRVESDDLLTLRNDISSGYKIPNQNIVIITGEDFKPTDAITSAIMDNQLKTFGSTSESAFHAVLLFGVFFGLTEKVVEDGRISSTIIEALRTLGVDEKEIENISRGGLFFTVKLVRVAETLQEFRNRKLFIEVAA